MTKPFWRVTTKLDNGVEITDAFPTFEKAEKLAISSSSGEALRTNPNKDKFVFIPAHRVHLVTLERVDS